MFGLPGGSELIIIAGIVALLFGSSKIPKLARAIGRSKSELQRGLKDGIKEGNAEFDNQP